METLMSQQPRSLVQGRRLFLKKTIGSGALLAAPALMFKAGAQLLTRVPRRQRRSSLPEKTFRSCRPA
jgi:hypothetical protein